MRKQSLIVALEDAIEFEEAIIPRLAAFYSKEIGWSSLPVDSRKEIRGILQRLMRESRMHRKKLHELLGSIRRDGRDEY